MSDEKLDLIEQHKEDPKFLIGVINGFFSHQPLTDGYGPYPVPHAIRYLHGSQPSEFFEETFDRLARSEEPFSELRERRLANWHEKADAVMGITNQAYLIALVERVPDDYSFGYQSPEALTVYGVTDQVWLTRILATKKDQFIVDAALHQCEDERILWRYANVPGAGAPAGSGRETYPIGVFRRTATGKLKYLHEKHSTAAIDALNNVRDYGIGSSHVDDYALLYGITKGIFDRKSVVLAQRLHEKISD
ncbi:MAG: hypothetical protein WC613_04295 [Candidatus Aenigmatarchaeota archaeon]